MDKVKGWVSPMKRRGQILWGIKGEEEVWVLLVTLVLGACSGIFVQLFVWQWDVVLFCFGFSLLVFFSFSFLSFGWWHYILKCNMNEYTRKQ